MSAVWVANVAFLIVSELRISTRTWTDFSEPAATPSDPFSDLIPEQRQPPDSARAGSVVVGDESLNARSGGERWRRDPIVRTEPASRRRLKAVPILVLALAPLLALWTIPRFTLRTIQWIRAGFS
jgi:hypothetical protein